MVALEDPKLKIIKVHCGQFWLDMARFESMFWDNSSQRLFHDQIWNYFEIMSKYRTQTYHKNALSEKSSENWPKYGLILSKLATLYLSNLQFRVFQGNQKLKFMMLAISWDLQPSLGIKNKELSLSLAKMAQKGPGFTLIKPQKANFAQI